MTTSIALVVLDVLVRTDLLLLSSMRRTGTLDVTCVSSSGKPARMFLLSCSLLSPPDLVAADVVAVVVVVVDASVVVISVKVEVALAEVEVAVVEVDEVVEVVDTVGVHRVPVIPLLVAEDTEVDTEAVHTVVADTEVHMAVVDMAAADMVVVLMVEPMVETKQKRG
mmetsp:Transcript_39704/g.102153  ORF Transcript_39704/g.102153 Transcript_39704/m.102153 type:complete len:167 (+) Transcript_39704:1583-2083(+)